MTTEQQEKLVCFSLGEQVFGLPIDSVREAVALRPITPVFLVPSFVRGIMNLRGEVVAVLDLARMLGLEVSQIREHGRVVIVRHLAATTDGRSRDIRVAGLLADTLHGVEGLDPDTIQPPPATLPSGVTTHLKGLVSRPDRPLLLLDLERIFESERLAPFKQGRRASG